MDWKRIPLESIVTKKVIYFDEGKKTICKRICDILMIDCFPDLHENKYWIFQKKWESKDINYSDLLYSITDAFDLQLKDLFAKNASNIIFTSISIIIFMYLKGILGFYYVC